MAVGPTCQCYLPLSPLYISFFLSPVSGDPVGGGGDPRREEGWRLQRGPSTEPASSAPQGRASSRRSGGPSSLPYLATPPSPLHPPSPAPSALLPPRRIEQGAPPPRLPPRTRIHGAERRHGHGEWSRGAVLPPSIRGGSLALPPRRRHLLVELRAERQLHGARGREEGGRAVGGGPSLPPLQAAAPLVTLLDRHNAAAEDAAGGERAGRRRAGVLGAERAAASSTRSRSRTPLRREKEGDREKRERGR